MALAGARMADAPTLGRIIRRWARLSSTTSTAGASHRASLTPITQASVCPQTLNTVNMAWVTLTVYDEIASDEMEKQVRILPGEVSRVQPALVQDRGILGSIEIACHVRSRMMISPTSPTGPGS